MPPAGEVVAVDEPGVLPLGREPGVQASRSSSTARRFSTSTTARMSGPRPSFWSRRASASRSTFSRTSSGLRPNQSSSSSWLCGSSRSSKKFSTFHVQKRYPSREGAGAGPAGPPRAPGRRASRAGRSAGSGGDRRPPGRFPRGGESGHPGRQPGPAGHSTPPGGRRWAPARCRWRPGVLRPGAGEQPGRADVSHQPPRWPRPGWSPLPRSGSTGVWGAVTPPPSRGIPCWP